MNTDDPTGPNQWAATSLEHFDQLARGVLRAARDATRELRRRSPDQQRLTWALGVLAGQTHAMLDLDRPAHPPVGAAAQRKFVCSSLQLAVHALAHRWTKADLGLAGQAEVPHLGERQAADAFDVLGRLMLPHASSEGWAATICTDLARGDEKWEVAVKLGKYILHPTFLTLADDATRVVGKAVHNISVDRLQELADSVRNFAGAAEPSHPATEPTTAFEGPAPEPNPTNPPMPIEKRTKRRMFEPASRPKTRRRNLEPPRRLRSEDGNMDRPGPARATLEEEQLPEPPQTPGSTSLHLPGREFDP
ncbi:MULTISPECIES: hypothetical protein [Streptomyces]|uniref:Uncharacterized protein n=1 Tax=Streptomyces sviceus (strain ATCC 29083 / DSM 924 / JCM 4929 / NBRC 13980 / NCIMB 11184 / NRRL 5439 / UC 5370) TaxID=463191 RepID=B5HS79_STRX2|nr:MULTISPECIES: hypothetical protein [Streptomyces]EDY55684.1 conserved hypothetical protein [Streptomyces sviceus ATCC 29083]